MAQETSADTHWLRALILILFQVMLVMVPLTWTSATSELFEFPKMLLVYAFALTIGCLWLTLMAVERKILFKRTVFDVPLALYAASQVLSTLFSIDRHTSLWGYYSRFHGGLMSTLSYIVLFYVLVNVVSSKQIKRLFGSLMLGAVLGSLYAFGEHFGHSPSCALITGEFTASCWVQDVQTRVFGTFGQPNWLAAYLIAIIFVPLSSIWTSLRQSVHFGAVLKTLKRPAVMLNVFYVSLFFVVLLFTKSRSGFLGFGVGLGLLVLLQLLTVKAKGALARGVMISLLLLGLLFVIFGRGALPSFDRAVSNVVRKLVPTEEAVTPEAAPKPQAGTQLENGGTESGEIRKIVWRGALASWRRYPLFGSGVETYAYSYYNVRPVEHNLVSEWDFLYNKAHNEFLNTLATTGAFGLGTLLVFMFWYSWWVVLSLRDTKMKAETRSYLTGMLAGFWALAVSNFFGFSTVPVGLLFYFFPAWSYVLLKNRESAKGSRASEANIVTYASFAMVGLIMVIGTVQLASILSADIAYAKGKRQLHSGTLQTALVDLERATQLNPNVGVYAEELSIGLAQGASSLAQNGQATAAAQLGNLAINWSDRSIQLNQVHLNFYKTRARVFVYLAQLKPDYIKDAQQALIKAATIAPTDAKIAYNIGLLYEQLGDLDAARSLYESTLEMKPNYEEARLSLGDLYVAIDEPGLAREQYLYILTYLNDASGPVIERLGKLENE